MEKKLSLLIILMSILGIQVTISQEISPAYYWDFNKVSNGKLEELIKMTTDTIEGNYTIVEGAKGKAIRLDGFTSVIRNRGNIESISEGSVSTEAWVALGAYPWNWCPVVTQSKAVVGGKEASGGFSMNIGPRGELGFKIFIEGNEILCVSDNLAIPLFEWVHIASTYDENSGLTIYINGKQVSYHKITGSVNYSRQ